MKKLLACAAAIAALTATTAAHAVTYPSIGNDTNGPEFLITITSGGATIADTGMGQGPFDGTEDTYIGVINNSGGSISFLDLTGTSIFGFDGDGLCAYNGAACSTYDPAGENRGYAGGGLAGFTNTFFTNSMIDNNHGRLNFQGGLASGGQAFFSLEEQLAGADVQITHIGGAVPEPASWAMMILGFFGVGSLVRSRRQAAAVA